ncbi:MAG: GntR family transcriptional regulator / MocR family aminotransferase [Acidobacteriota bacterium]|jgi:GntR family transcriptional regulator/MocR family aminotransferase|nr:GntR family transcriptional regulator / MocR family aminotransferase [Acidobacteriota bacterium]
MLLDLTTTGPLYRRIYDALRTQILRGELVAGAPLPGTRTLARDLGVSRIVVLAAFEQLAAEGYIESTVGSGSRVAVQVAPVTAPARRRSAVTADAAVSAYARRARQLSPQEPPGQEHPPADGAIDFRYATTVPDARTVALWRQAITRAAGEPRLDYPDPAGLPLLRRVLAEHLREQRGVVADAEDIIIVSGAQQALDLTARVLCDRGTRIGLEDPHYQGTRQAFVAAGGRVVACPVDADGLDIERHARRLGDARAICVTPSHQFPTGAIMTVARRLALLQWAQTRRAWIVEDDYDCEFRYGVGAVAALQGLDTNGRVIYIGTFARMLFPALRLGYIVTPPALRDTFRAVKWLADRGSAPLEQQALATLLESGAYESTRRRTVRALTTKRDTIVAALATHFPDDDVLATGAASGTHLFLRLPRLPLDATDRLLATARTEGVHVYSAHPYYQRPPRHVTLILGYTTVATADIPVGIERLAAAYAKV